MATKAEATTKPENQWSALQVERLLAAHHSLKNTEEDVERLKGETAEAKKLREERWQNLDACISEAGESLKGELMDIETQRRIFALDADYRRAIEQHELSDRTYRRVLDQSKKLLERLRTIIELNRGEEDLYSNAAGASKGDPNAWLLVPLADIVGEMIAGAFAAVDAVNVEAFIDAAKAGTIDTWVTEEGIKPTYLNYAAVKIVEYAEARGNAGRLPKWFKTYEGGVPDVPDTREERAPKSAVAAAAGDDGQDAVGDEKGEGERDAPGEGVEFWDAATPFRRESYLRLGEDRGAQHQWLGEPFAVSLAKPDDEGRAPLLAELAEWHIETPRKFLSFLDELFESRDPELIARDMLTSPDGIMGEALDLIADRLYRFGTPAVFALLDSLAARCESAFESLVRGSRLASVAAFPADQRYGRDVPVEHVDAAGKVTREPAKSPKQKKRGPKYHQPAPAPKKQATKKSNKSKKAAKKGKK